MIHQFRGI